MEVTTPAAGAAGRDRPLPRSTGRRASRTATWAARAGCTTTTSSPSGSPRSASTGRAPGTPTSSIPGREFFADYGVYDVQPHAAARVRGGGHRRAAGAPRRTPTAPRRCASSRRTSTTSPGRPAGGSVERTGRFDDPGYPPVDIRLLVQPEHAAPGGALHRGHADRAAQLRRLVRALPLRADHGGGPGLGLGLRAAWSTRRSSPAARTSGRRPRCRAPRASPSTSAATSSGTAWWAPTSSRRPGSTRASTATTTRRPPSSRWGRSGWGKRYFGLTSRRAGARGGWPVVAPGVWIGRGENDLSALRADGQTDVMARPGWHYLTRPAYTLNSYGKPALSPADAGGARGRRDHDADPAHVRPPLPLRPSHQRGLHRGRERGHGPGLRLVLRPDVVLERPVRLRGHGAQPRAAAARGLRGRPGRAGRSCRAAARRARDATEPPTSRGDGAPAGRGAPARGGAGGVRGRPHAHRDLGRPGPLDALRVPRRTRDARRGRSRAARSRSTSTPPTTPGWTRRAWPGAPRASGRRAICSGSSTCSSCTRWSM